MEDENKIRRDLFDLLKVIRVNLLFLQWFGALVFFCFAPLLVRFFLHLQSYHCSILQNIVLIRDPEDAKKFYPRFNLEDTTSFKDLDDHRYQSFGSC